MVNRILVFVLCCFLFSQMGDAQQKSLSVIIADKTTQIGISDVHLFLSNSTFGAFTDVNGLCQFNIPNSASQDLIISHISYFSYTLEAQFYHKLKDLDTIYLESSGINIDDIVITSKRDKNWKKNLKTFTDAFIGDDRNAEKCKIINPEVLRFSDNELFRVTAIDMLHLRNDYLGYEIDFLLKELTITVDGSVNYIGNAKFKDISSSNNLKKKLKNRDRVFKSSPRQFFLSLINDSIKKDGFDLRELSYDHGVFKLLQRPKRDSIITYDKIYGTYKLEFSEFLEITNRKIKSLEPTELGNIGKGLESTRFSNAVDGTKDIIRFAKSMIYKNSDYLVINKYGHVINQKSVQEYGDWATQRMATALPWDYAIDYSRETEADSYFSTDNSQDTLNGEEKLELLKELIYSDSETYESNIRFLRNNWSNEYVAPLLEIIRLSADTRLVQIINNLLQEKVGRTNMASFYKGSQWLWTQDPSYNDYYFDFKSEIYQHVDPKFKKYFTNRSEQSTIRLDEVMWGGVAQDGIPPLRYPEMIASETAEYLNNNDVIFGFVINGEARAYPKRILAWHEFFIDAFGDRDVAGVYCTLCGTVIAYDLSINGVKHDLGTSGFLYRSNKLMYDQATQSLWSTIEGRPVIGPLVTQDLTLTTYPVITTIWKEWKKAYPKSKVLSLNTGHNRNYNEGVAYKDYFATDELMFPVPIQDDRLNNKDEVFVLRAEGYRDDPLAISVDYIKKKKIHHDSIAEKKIIVISDATGNTKSYQSNQYQFVKYKKNELTDTDGDIWEVRDDAIISNSGVKLNRVPGHNIFWFAWVNSYPDTRLINK